MNKSSLPSRSALWDRRRCLHLCIGGAIASLNVGALAQTEPQTAPAIAPVPIPLPAGTDPLSSDDNPAPAASADNAPSTPSAPSTPPPPVEQAPLAGVTVVGTTPLFGTGTPLRNVPANVQTIRSRDLERQHSGTLTDYFSNNLGSVDINSAQGNQFQADVNYRGFTASPLLGTPQGLSVFLDGVRINEPFGDVVNWDLIPQSAIAAIQVIPGSNPTFGLNTLGGALAITTKDGKTAPGGSAEVSGGSFGRKTAMFQQGGTLGEHLDYYFTANGENDGGWADHNSSQVRQYFGKLRYTDADTTIGLSVGTANDTLQGSQTIPRSFLNNYRQAYTFPDLNENRATFLNLTGDHYFNDHVELSGNVYYRKYHNTNISSNVSDDFGSVDDDGNINLTQASNEKSVIDANSYGASLQLTLLGKLGGLDNQLIAGVAADFADTRFSQFEQDANFTPSRAAIGTGDYSLDTDAKTRNATYGIYLSDTLALSPHWALTLAGRYNWSKVQISDQTGDSPLLNGNHNFSRFNPAAGLNWNPVPGFTAYASYNEGMRSPTAIELACADPAAPCSLPNDFLADPALKPVISKTFEVGARGRVGFHTHWNAAVYNTTLTDDIQFISSNGASVNSGFFQNVGKTRRRGFELGGDTRFGPLGVAVNYSYVNATYQSSWTENSGSNSTADSTGTIQVKPGDRIPGIPQDTIKVRFDYAATPKWNVGANLIYRTSIFARGDENNQDVNGSVAGYMLVNLDTTYQVSKSLQVFARVDNLLNKRYADFSILGENFFDGPNHTFDGNNTSSEQFLGLGAPRGFWVGLRYAWL